MLQGSGGGCEIRTPVGFQTQTVFKLTQNDLQQFYARLKKGGRRRLTEFYGEGLSDRMVRFCHTTCRTALEKAVVEGLITNNPAIGCRLPPKKAKEMQVLTQAEILRFLTRAKEEGYYEMFLLELTTGMRRGEIIGLKWRDLNLQTGELRITRQVVKTGSSKEISVPKTKSSVRTILLPLDMVELLAELKKHTKGGVDVPVTRERGRTEKSHGGVLPIPSDP